MRGWADILRPRQKGFHFVDGIFKYIFFNENFWILHEICSIGPNWQWVRIGSLIMAWHCTGDKPQYKPMMAQFTDVYMDDSALVNYRQTSNISHDLVSNKFFDHSNVVGCSNYIVVLDLTSGFNVLGKDNCKTKQETFKFWDLVWLTLEVWR